MDDPESLRHKKLTAILIGLEIAVFYGPMSVYSLIGIVLLPHQIIGLVYYGAIATLPVIAYLLGGYVGWYLIFTNLKTIIGGRRRARNVECIGLLMFAMAGISAAPIAGFVSFRGEDWIVRTTVWMVMPISCLIHTTVMAIRYTKGRKKPWVDKSE